MSLPLRLMLLLACSFWPSVHAWAQDWVEFPGRGDLRLRAQIFRPSGDGPFPAVVALHGCGGLGNAKGIINPRHADWGTRLQAAGFIVLFPESFLSRGLGAQCNVRDRDVRSKDRAYDAFAAAEWLAAHPDVDRRRIALLGWSNGGTSVLSASRTIRSPKGVEFRHAVAFYPGCKGFAEQDFRIRIPLTILHGLADDWTAAEPCRALPGVRFIGYDGAHHDFDHPSLPVRTRKAAFSANGSGTVTIGTHPAAREDAIRQVMTIFQAM